MINLEEDKTFNLVSVLKYLKLKYGRFKIRNFSNKKMRKLDYNLVLRKLLEKFTNSIHIKDEISKQEKVQKILKNRSLIIEIGVKGCGRRVKTIYFSSQTNKLQLLKDLFQIDYNKDLEKTLSFYRANNSLTNFCFNFSTC